MIAANEIRIGNLLYADWKPSHIVAVKEIREFKVIVNCNDWSGLKHDEVSPIPLTPEILEKCGFDGTKKEGVYMLTFYRDEELHWSRVDPYIVYFAHDGKFMKYFRDTVHVHQLQNLFYSLTAEELNVQL